MSARVPSRGSDQFNLRLPDGMRDALKVEAEIAGRSLNAEIVSRLARSLAAGQRARMVRSANLTEEEKAEGYAATDDIARRLAQLSAELEAIAVSSVAKAEARRRAEQQDSGDTDNDVRQADPGGFIRKMNSLGLDALSTPEEIDAAFQAGYPEQYPDSQSSDQSRSTKKKGYPRRD